jgi:phospholipase C
MPTLEQIDTIVIVMMENRSFDHLIGYLSLPDFGVRLPVDGIPNSPALRIQYANPGPPNNFLYEQIPLCEYRIADPPHERTNIAQQLGTPDAAGVFPMKGFVSSAQGDPEVMQYYGPTVIPVTDFLARNFRICDKWFAPLPAGTQPNRLMAMSGITEIDSNVSLPQNFPNQELVYDWLTERGISWRVYHQGFFPFFSLMPRMLEQMVTSDKFRRFDRMAVDFELEPTATFPKVIFIEPKYTDAPHEGEGSDDHSPSSLLGGQHFLLEIYNALISNSQRWRATVMILTYDEHGGFFDHAQPLPITTKAPGHQYPDFISTGVRVPSIVVSPFVTGGSVYSQPLDHTSILKFIGQKFGGGSYSPEVDGRPIVGSVLDVLDLNAPLQAIPTAPDASKIPAADSYVRAFRELTDNVQIFHQVADLIVKSPKYAHAIASKFPETRELLGIGRKPA